MGNLYVIGGLFFPQHRPFGSGRECIRPFRVLLKPPGPLSFARLPRPDPAILCIDCSASDSSRPLSGPGFLGTQESVYLFIQRPQAATVYSLPSLPHTHPSLRQCLAVGKSVGPALCFLDLDKLQGFSALSGHCRLLLFLYGTLQFILTFPLCLVSSVNCLLTHLHLRAHGNSLELAGVCLGAVC